MYAPVFVMFFLTFVVWLVMYALRFRYMAANKITPQRIATPEAVATLLPEWVNRPSDNLQNLFEMPVLFYVVCAIAIFIQANDTALIVMAWGFVVLRVIHSLIHCTVNLVSVRFLAYFLSSILLFFMGVRLAYLVV